MGAFFLERGLVIERLGVLLEYQARAGRELYFEAPETGQRVTIGEDDFWSELHTLRIRVVDAFASPGLLLTPESGQSPADPAIARTRWRGE